jgi:hypothetical protein
MLVKSFSTRRFSTHVRNYGDAPKWPLRPDRKARKAWIAKPICAPSNTAGRDAAAIECKRIYE